MAFNFGQFSEFSDPVTLADPVVEAVARAIELNPFIGKFYESMGAPSAGLSTKEFAVYRRSETSRDGSIDAAWDIDGVSGLGVGDDSLKGITIGHVLLVGDEVVIVSAVDRSAGTISVHKRGDGGTTAAIHTSGDSFKVIGFAGRDEDLKNVESVTEATSEWTNFVQTVFETVDWTKHGELMRQGLDSVNATVMLIREGETRIAKLLARMSILGVKAQGTSSAGRYMSAGLLAQIGDVTNRGARRYNVNGELTETKFKAALKAMFDAGGTANAIWCSPTVKGVLNGFIGSRSATITTGIDNHLAGGIYAVAYDYEGAVLKINVDADIPNSRLSVLNSADCKKGWLKDDGLRLVDEPSASSREMRKSLQGSVGFMIENVGINHTDLYGITAA